MTATDTDTTTYAVKMANEYHWVDFHINASSEEEAREKARALAEDGELADAAKEEYKMAQNDDRYDPTPREYRYRIDLIEEADEHAPRAEDAPHMVKSGGNG